MGVERLIGTGGHQPTHPSQTPNTIGLYRGSQTVGDNLHGREGNNPDRQLRSLIEPKFLRRCDCHDSQDVGLEAATV